MTREEAQALVAIIAAAWTRPPVEEATVYAYAFALADLDHDAAKAAVLRLMQTSRFLPTIAEIRECAVRNRVSLPSPEEAWGMVRRAIGRHGARQTPAFDCDEVQAAVDAIGWRSICLDENEAASRARFCAAMQSFTARRMEAEASGRYVAADRQLPEPTDPTTRGFVADGEPVLVETGYATARRPPTALSPAPEDQADELGRAAARTLAGRFSSRRDA